MLVVDNEPPIAMVIRRVLGPGHDITAREDAAEACRLVREGAEFDVILCDLLMPGMSGEQFYDVLARLAPHLKKRVARFSRARRERRARQTVHQRRPARRGPRHCHAGSR